MKIERKTIPEEMKKTMGGVKEEGEPTSKTLQSLRELEQSNTKKNVKAVFFINLTYVIGLIFLTVLALESADSFVIGTIAVTTIGALIYNLVAFNETRRTKKHLKLIKKLEKLNED